MTRHKESKTRELDLETRQTGPGARIGFAIVVIGAIIALLLVLLG